MDGSQPRQNNKSQNPPSTLAIAFVFLLLAPIVYRYPKYLGIGSLYTYVADVLALLSLLISLIGFGKAVNESPAARQLLKELLLPLRPLIGRASPDAWHYLYATIFFVVLIAALHWFALSMLHWRGSGALVLKLALFVPIFFAVFGVALTVDEFILKPFLMIQPSTGRMQTKRESVPRRLRTVTVGIIFVGEVAGGMVVLYQAVQFIIRLIT